jgi:DNA-directed RNA polymerase subunit RPC12/RpoP
MGRLNELEVSRMKYPFGRCAECGEKFDSVLRNEYHITHCPYCGTKIDDFMSFVDSTEEREKRSDLFCDDCGRRIYEATEDGESDDWIDGSAGVCGHGRELCESWHGVTENWHGITGLCHDCHEEYKEECGNA